MGMRRTVGRLLTGFVALAVSFGIAQPAAFAAGSPDASAPSQSSAETSKEFATSQSASHQDSSAQGQSSSASASAASASSDSSSVSPADENSSGGGGLAKQPDSSVANDSAQLASQSDPPQTTPVVSPQGVTCNTVPLHTPWTGTGGTLLYNIQLSGDGNDCVLELESGTIPNYGGNVRMIPWIGHTPSGGWYYSNNVTKIIVSSHVYALCVSALFIGMLELKSADVTNLDLSNLQFGLFQGMFQCDEKLSSITGIEY